MVYEQIKSPVIFVKWQEGQGEEWEKRLEFLDPFLYIFVYVICIFTCVYHSVRVAWKINKNLFLALVTIVLTLEVMIILYST